MWKLEGTNVYVMEDEVTFCLGVCACCLGVCAFCVLTLCLYKLGCLYHLIFVKKIGFVRRLAQVVK
jgi:uncharacterized membrane protein